MSFEYHNLCTVLYLRTCRAAHQQRQRDASKHSTSASGTYTRAYGSCLSAKHRSVASHCYRQKGLHFTTSRAKSELSKPWLHRLTVRLLLCISNSTAAVVCRATYKVGPKVYYHVTLACPWRKPRYPSAPRRIILPAPRSLSSASALCLPGHAS